MCVETLPAAARFAAHGKSLSHSARELAATRFSGVVAVAAMTLLGISLVFRFLWLDRLPGINGDEAWYGVQVLRFLDGKPWSALTPSKLPINPLLFATEAALVSCFEPSFWVLRLPIALWSCVGLALAYALHRLAFEDRVEALLVATLTACLPAHLAYSRICWDSGFGFVSFPLVLYGLLMLVERRHALPAGFAFGVGALLTLWTHVTNALFIAAGLGMLGWEYRREIWGGARRKPITSGCVAAALGACVWLGAHEASSPLKIAAQSAQASFQRLPRHLSALGDILFGPRVYEYFAGVPRPDWTHWGYPLLLIVVAASAILLYRRGTHCDRVFVGLIGLTCILLLLAGRALRLHDRSYERYVLYFVPLAALLIVRAVRAWARLLSGATVRLGALPTLAVSAGFLAPFWFNYFEPLRFQTYAGHLHPTFRTGLTEPKAELSAAIRQRQAAGGAVVVVIEDWKQDWWVHYPLQYLLGAQAEVFAAVDPAQFDGTVFVVGAANSRFIECTQSAATDRGRLVETLHFEDAARRPVWQLLVLSPTTIDGPPRLP